MERVKRYRRTTRITLFCCAILVGLGLARKLPPVPILYVWLFGIFAVVSFRRARLISVYAVMLFGLALGCWRGGVYMDKVGELDKISRQTITLTGTALSDAVYDEYAQLSFNVGDLKLELPEEKSLVGKVSVSGFGEKMVYRGDQVRVKGKFSPSRGSLVAYISFAEVEVTGKSHSVIFDLTRRFASGLGNALPEPHASFSLGILIGQRDTLPEETKEVLAVVGLTHIIAASGYNLTILVQAVKRIAGKRSKYQTLIASLVLIFCFLLATGASASIVRASIISVLSLAAWYYGRAIKPLLLISFTAALTALWSPLYLWSDIGWYLSFLAFFGVLVIAPLLNTRLFQKEPGLLGGLMIETVCAQIMTLPFILYIFSTSSFIALLANVFIVPLIPLAMLLSFIAGLAGMFIAPLAGWLAWPAQIILTYVLDMATIFSRVPHMQFSVTVSLIGMLILYAAIVCVILALSRRKALTVSQ